MTATSRITGQTVLSVRDLSNGQPHTFFADTTVEVTYLNRCRGAPRICDITPFAVTCTEFVTFLCEDSDQRPAITCAPGADISGLVDPSMWLKWQAHIADEIAEQHANSPLPIREQA